MKRIAALLVTGVVAATPASAFAYLRGEPHPGSCGIGNQEAHEAIQNAVAPGASDLAHITPAESGCTGR